MTSARPARADRAGVVHEIVRRPRRDPPAAPIAETLDAVPDSYSPRARAGMWPRAASC